MQRLRGMRKGAGLRRGVKYAKLVPVKRHESQSRGFCLTDLFGGLALRLDGGKIALGIEGGHAAQARCRHGLPIGIVRHIPCCKDTGTSVLVEPGSVHR